MSIQKGTYIRVNTKPSPGQHKDETPFGTCVWQILEMGLECPEPFRKKDAAGNDLPADKIPMDGVKCVMIGGSGPSARAGYTVIDSLMQINHNIKEGITSIVPEADVKRIESQLVKIGEAAQSATQGGAAGCLEVD